MIIKQKFVYDIIPLCEKIFELAKMPPMINEYAIRKISENFNFSNAKAVKELGFEVRPLVESLKDTVKWLEKNKKK